MPQERIAQLDWSLGITRDMSPHLIDERAVYDLVNALLDERGSPYKRGGTENKSGAAFGSDGLRFLWDGFFDPGQRTIFANPDDFAVLDSDDSTVINLGSDGLSLPKPSAFIEGMLFIGGGYIYAGSRKTALYNTGTVTATNGSKTVTGAGVTWNTLVDAGMLFQAGDERAYVVASVDTASQITLRDNYEGSTGAGKAYNLHHFYKLTTADPYELGEFYTVCANRLIRASGKSVFFSEVLKPHDWTVTIGAQEITNEHKLPEGVRITGLATVGQTLLVFTTRGTWTIEGLAFNITDPDGNSQHRVQLLSADQTLWSNTGIATWQQSVIVPALDGIYMMDGISEPVRISHPIDQLYRFYVQRGYRAGQAAVYRGHYFLPIITSGADMRDLLVARLDRAVESEGQTVFPWTRFADAGGSITAYAVRALDTPAEPLLLGAEAQTTSRVVDCSPYFEPDAEHKNDADGTTPLFMLITRDYPTGNLTTNMVRKLSARYELLDAASDNPTLDFEYGFGVREEGGFVWDGYDWSIEVGSDPDDLFWEGEGDDFFESLDCSGPVDDGRNLHSCRVNTNTRWIRFRLTNSRPCASLRLRELHVWIRPSKAVRR